jgi:diguanylate cyclase (GGDEF)-like protein
LPYDHGMDQPPPPSTLDEAQQQLAAAQAELRDAQSRLRAAEAQVLEAHAQMDEMAALLFEQTAADALTGLKNRTAFDRIMRQQASRSGRSEANLSLVVVDVDDLSAFNVRHGRIGGDDVLQQVANVLKRHARAYDYVVRYDGDSFVLVLPDTPLEGAKVVGDRTLSGVRSVPWRHAGVSVSVGVATAVTSAEGQTLVDRALAACASAHAAGGNRLVA